MFQRFTKRSYKTFRRAFTTAHDAKHVACPYDLPHHPTYPEKAFFLGVNPATYKLEGWEFPYLAVFVFSVAVIITGHTLENDAFVSFFKFFF
jgi:hypothetical protein